MYRPLWHIVEITFPASLRNNVFPVQMRTTTKEILHDMYTIPEVAIIIALTDEIPTMMTHYAKRKVQKKTYAKETQNVNACQEESTSLEPDKH